MCAMSSKHPFSLSQIFSQGHEWKKKKNLANLGWALWTRLGRGQKLIRSVYVWWPIRHKFLVWYWNQHGLCLNFRYIEMYLRPPAQQDTSKISDWIRMRQCGIRYELAEGYQRIVDKHFIIKPRAEFEVRDFTLDIGLSSYIYELFYRRGHSRWLH